MEQGSTVKRTVRFITDEYAAVSGALKGLGLDLEKSILNRTEGIATLWVKKGTKLDAFKIFTNRQEEEKESENELRARLFPFEHGDKEGLNKVYQLLLSDYARTITRIYYEKGIRIKVFFISKDVKVNFITLVKDKHAGDVTIQA